MKQDLLVIGLSFFTGFFVGSNITTRPYWTEVGSTFHSDSVGLCSELSASCTVGATHICIDVPPEANDHIVTGPARFFACVEPASWKRVPPCPDGWHLVYDIKKPWKLDCALPASQADTARPGPAR